MAVSNVTYTEWLKTDGQHRVVLAVLEHYNGTEYISTYPFVTDPNASIPNIPFIDSLVDIPIIKRSIDGSTAFGNLEVINVGELDDWYEYKWRGYSIKIYFGDMNWEFDDFRLVMSGTNGGINRFDNTNINFNIYDKRLLLDVNIPMTYTDYDEFIPIALGTVFNATPILKDHTPIPVEYYASDGACTVVDLRDSGLDVNHIDILDGTFTKSTSSSGVLTVDIEQADTTLSEMVINLCNRISFTDIDTDQINSFPNTADLGLFISNETSVSSALTEICDSFGAYWSFSRLGLLQVTQFSDSSATGSYETEMIVNGDFSSTSIPEWTTLNSSLSVSLSRLRMTANAASGYAYYYFTTSIGKSYSFSVQLQDENTSVLASVSFGTDSSKDLYYTDSSTIPITFTGSFVAESIESVLTLTVTESGDYVEWDNISVIEFTDIEISDDTTLDIADHIIYVDDIIDGEGEIVEIIDPEETTILNYKKNWTVQDYLAGAVAEEDAPLYRNEYSNAEITNTIVGYPIPVENRIIDTLIVDATEAEQEAVRRSISRAEKHKIFSFNCFAAPFIFEVGDTIEINYSRFNLDGVNMKLIEITEYPADNKASLKLWI